MAAHPEGGAPLKVWDRPVRVLHWSLALACLGAWITAEAWVPWHEAFGYAAAALVAARTAWGSMGGPYARLSQFVRGPRATWAYARDVLGGRAPRYLGHNPLGGWMALALWGCVAALGLTGWLYTTDRFFGEPWLDGTHEALAWLLVVLVACHLAGVVLTGRRHADRLVRAMVTGKKRPAGPGDVA